MDFERFVECMDNQHGLKIVLLMANSGPSQTMDGIVAAGIRCVDELTRLFETQVPPGSCVSFIGHSMGGLILRYALAHLDESVFSHYTPKFLICIATPHLGVSSSESMLVRHGTWWFRHFSQTATDLVNKSESLLQLSKSRESLSKFHAVVFYGNRIRDRIVSLRSALALKDITHVPPASQLDGDVMTITPFCGSNGVEDPPDLDNTAATIAHNINTGLQNIKRFIVDSPSGFLVEKFDNSAHTRIIAHAMLDRNKVGLPMVHHVLEILCQESIE